MASISRGQDSFWAVRLLARTGCMKPLRKGEEEVCVWGEVRFTLQAKEVASAANVATRPTHLKETPWNELTEPQIWMGAGAYNTSSFPPHLCTVSAIPRGSVDAGVRVFRRC